MLRVRPICRPSQGQHIFYNGHKRVHSLKFEQALAANGIIVRMFSPIGRLNKFCFQTKLSRDNSFGRLHNLHRFNQSMSDVRETVEWSFGEITTYWAFRDFKKNLKIGMSAVGKQYLVATLLKNALVCCYGSQVSQYFGLAPPKLEEYFH